MWDRPPTADDRGTRRQPASRAEGGVLAVDENKLNAFMGQFVQDLGATVQAGMVVLGHRLGLYRAMAGAGPLSPAELAERTGTAERYVREWLAAQAAAGYVAYNPASGRFSLPEEQAFALADPAGPVYLPGAFQLALASLKGEPRIAEAFRTGAGVGWHEQDPEVFDGCEMFFAPGYRANLVQSWIPALDGVEARLQAGARVADVGCGHGASTIIMARAYPRSTFVGFDYRDRSIESARKAASEAGVSDRVHFEVARPTPSPGTATTWWRPSTASTTWATRPGRPPTSAAPSPTTAPGCWSSRPPATARRTTSTRSGGCTTASRCCSACPTPSPSSQRPCSATRPARPAPASWPPPAASPASAGPPRPRST